MPIVPSPATIPACLARDVAVSTDARHGDFNGISHSGIYLVIRNNGRNACRMPGLPLVTLRGAAGQALARRRPPAGMHPGPVIAPIAIPAGGRVATGLRWVSGPVYDRNCRVDIRSATIVIAGRTLRASLRAEVYSQAGEPATFEQVPLAPFR